MGPSDNPIICEIFNDTGTYITSCYSHDRISYIKQCYVESCGPPPLQKNIMFKLLANPSFHNFKNPNNAPLLRPNNSDNNKKREQSKSSSPAFSYVSNSSNNLLQRVILLDDADTMIKYKKYSLSANHSNKNNAKRLIFQIRIEHISQKHKHKKKKMKIEKKQNNKIKT